MPPAPLDPRFLDLLCHPHHRRPLQQQGGELVEPRSGDRFPVHRGIPRLASPAPSSRQQLTRLTYNLFAFAYEPTLHIGARLGLTHEVQVRRTVLAQLALPSGSWLLELGCGAAGNRPYLPRQINYLGLDTSMPMLRQAASSLAASPSDFLLQADAQQPPLREARFDLLLAMGLIQHLDSPLLAFQTWLKLLRPGGRLLVMDEQRRLAQRLGVSTVDQITACFSAYRQPTRQPHLVGDYLCLHFAAQD